MADRITSLRPSPTALSVGGRPFSVHQATIADLFALQAWVDTKSPDQLASIHENAAGLTGAERDRLLFDAYDLAEDAASIDGPEGRRLLTQTPEGLTVFLSVALKVSADFAAAVLAEATPREVEAVRRAFFGANALAEIRGLLGLEGRRRAGEPATWGEAIDGLAAERGWTYAYIYSLSLSEFRNARRRGKPEETAFVVSETEAVALQRRITLARYGKTPEEVFGSPTSSEAGEGSSG